MKLRRIFCTFIAFLFLFLPLTRLQAVSLSPPNDSFDDKLDIKANGMLPTLFPSDKVRIVGLGENEKIRRGDVVAIRLPVKPSQLQVIRVVGIPGDLIAYQNKRVTINGVAQQTTALREFIDEETMRFVGQFEEVLDGVKHRILNDSDRPPFILAKFREVVYAGCDYTDIGVICKLPKDMYFMMGDNRDSSYDSRIYGYVPVSNLVGRATGVIANERMPQRNGASIR